MRLVYLIVVLVAAGGLITAVIGSLLGLYLRARLIRLLREKHPHVWTQLGAPSFGRDLAAQGAIDRGRLWRWVWTRQFEQLSDADTARVALGYRRVSLTTVTAVIALIALLVGARLKLW